MIVPALVTAPLIWAGVPPLLAYNLLFLSGFALSGAAMFLLVRSLTGSVPAGLLAGFIFAFLPYRFMHYAHLELQMSPWMPLCLWALHKTIENGRIRDGLLTGLFLALQCLSSWYYGIFLSTFMVPVAAVLLFAAGAARARAAIRALMAGAVLASLLIVPMAVPYFAAREHVGERAESEIRFYSALPRNYLAAHPQNVMFGRTTARLGAQERELFMGFVVPLLVLIGLWPPLSAARMAYGFGLVVAFDLSLGFNGMLYPWLHEYVLPYRGLRVPARMAMVVGLALAILAGYGIQRLAATVRGRVSWAVLFVALTLGVALEYRSVPMLRTIWTTAPPIYAALPAHSANVLLELPARAARHLHRTHVHVLLDVPLERARQRLQWLQSAVVHRVARRPGQLSRRRVDRCAPGARRDARHRARGVHAPRRVSAAHLPHGRVRRSRVRHRGTVAPR